MSLDQAHAQVFLDLLDADNTAPALIVLDGVVPTGRTPPYALVYVLVSTPGDGMPDGGDLGMRSRRVNADAYVHCVGGNAAAARAVAGRVDTALLDVTPTITGRVCSPIRQIDAQPPQRDESTGSVVMDLVKVYRFGSVPA